MINQGVYLIQNLTNNKSYVGSSTNIKNRFREHKRSLKNKNHHSEHLQRAYNKYGKDMFNYAILESVEDNTVLNETELKWILKLKTNDREFGYNICLPNPNYISGCGEHSEETKEKLRLLRYKTINETFIEEDYLIWKENLPEKRSNIPIDRSLFVFDKITGEKLYEFNSPTEASISMNLNKKKILAVLNKEIKDQRTKKITRSYKGFVFVYKREYDSTIDYKLSDYHIQNRIIEAYNLDGELIGEFLNIRHASEILNINQGVISNALVKNNRIIVKKFRVNYKNSI